MIEYSFLPILSIALPNVITIIVAFVPIFFKIWERKVKSINNIISDLISQESNTDKVNTLAILIKKNGADT
ncbi:hypothetical protein AVI51_11090 [Piscirickettsia salmonis]|uniref:Uncharacterized protein n=1 Tax=Piscirickettsia salmonis TaxID=1238 RepID=A0A9Q5VEL7_PISSA|nr:hypothetical protein [Piscirickettsia salmonis]ALA26441.1 ABC transporter [Piscirickettsia salmonis]APS43862.1 hypothetical protein AVI48_05410 [Piscirickettsia salmonis]APS47216.1 hypothetical protein AVI49_06010 [Piscirickettsia salmonis]APS51344.1 hypothetical protein AVI50_11205 [Piscirickettsia salmonis]APS54553.1 hypothetical protein AVI51_11090 [Piscirickettsia salmonis]